MRIAFDSQIFTLQRFGGISRYFVRLAEQLAAMQNDIQIFAPLHQNSYLEECDPVLLKGHSMPPAIRRGAKLLSPLNDLLAKSNIARFAPDLIHETYYSPNGTGIKKPCVITVHDMIHERFPEEFRSFSSTSARKRAAVMRADHIICISHSTQRDLQKFFNVAAEKTSVVHHGYEQFELASQPRATPAEKPYLLYVGLRGGYKNFAILLQAVAGSSRLLRDFDIVAFGGGSFSQVEEEAIARAGFAVGQVRQNGGSDAALSALYSGATAFVYCSKYEGFGFPPLEAMAHGLPVVSSNTSSMPEVIGDAAEFFEPTSADSLTHAISQVVYVEARREQLIALGHSRLHQFSWSRCAQDTLACYRRVAL